MISDLDAEGTGAIDFAEFLNMMTANLSDRDTREDIEKVFRLFDHDKVGHVTVKNLKRSNCYWFFNVKVIIYILKVAKELGENMDDYEL